MRKAILIGVMAVLLLSGCGTKGFQPEQIREAYAANQARASLTATTHNGYYCEYGIDYTEEEEGARVLVTAPDSVAGIAAHLDKDGISVIYEDVELDALTPNEKGLSPVDALFWILSDLRDRSPDNWALERDGSRTRLSLEYSAFPEDGSEVLKKLVLDGETLHLIEAELYRNGSLILSLHVKDFSLSPKESVASEGEL